MKIEPLTLPSGGRVQFDDPDNLRGGDYRRMRACYGPTGVGASYAQMLDDMSAIAAEVMVTAWEVPYLGQPMLPRTNPALIDELRGKDTAALFDHLRPFLNVYILRNTPDPDDDTPPPDGDPTPPASE